MNNTNSFEDQVRELIVSTVNLFITSDEKRTRSSLDRFLGALLTDKSNSTENLKVIEEAMRRIKIYTFEELQNIEQTVLKPVTDDDMIDRMIEELTKEVEKESASAEEEDDEEGFEEEKEEEIPEDNSSFYDRLTTSEKGRKFILVDNNNKEQNYYYYGNVYYHYGSEAFLLSKNKNPNADNSDYFKYEEDIDALSLIEDDEEIQIIKDKVKRKYSN